MAKQEIESFMDSHSITVESVCIPFSQSRNKGGWESLNWRVTLKVKGREVITTDYSAGIGHAPSYKATKAPAPYSGNLRMWKEAAGAFEIENGFAAIAEWGGIRADKKSPLMPEACNVLYSLASEAGVLNYSGFEDWAAEMGYDADSRKAEKIYRECIETALKLRAALGDDGLSALHTACEDY
jgi:hypothetical protein